MKALFILIILAVVGSIGYSLYVQYRIDEISAGYTSHEKEVISKEIIQAQSLPNVASPSGTWDMTSATCGEQDFTNNIPSHIFFNTNANNNAYTWQTDFKYLLAGKKLSEVGTFNIKGETIAFNNSKGETSTYNIKYTSPNQIILGGRKLGDCILTLIFIKTG
ncbi:TPA: hypothetical protein OXO44_003942 [Acinetobacter baumannii]|uniref:Lipocalin-like domain-containing protein n=1 Tax=Acinetobacter baumannii TaxID=470 RepID=A0A646LVF3_ACIBA|nr:lipocalin family protein [Acinetobacter baumannii]EHU3033144.1 hypothetical protein [Acinetobacter baumannii]EHZ7962027.1 hypothetical protein [Acinetobacter baumannii]EIB7144050.1 hypothetical protein [Acinetobacter baumannii]EKA78390.1 hypothetical protein ACINIS58_A0067 [Acinetobacter baumannii IS-58]EKK06739.1 hypothetical protein ACINIS235_A0098 [Acinetobacter baumannii IS-235]